ncbi:hypothetical protein ACE5IS_08230 [Leptospira wolffii]|uniref:LPXTG cell wall anchor domain-containing protein n=1 Tax=Leptospira wolffii TaxID=409998 RepID=A0ABV5BMI4_9LEPT
MHPILFTGLGLSALGWIFSASEWIGILGFLLSAGLFGIYRLRKKANPSCSADCACREKEPKEQ